MSQPDPICQFLLSSGKTQNVPQRPNLQAIKVLVHGILHERLELQNALFNLQPRLREDVVPILIPLRLLPLTSISIRPSQQRRIRSEQACFERVCAAV